ncbi:MAG: Peptidoglycan-N-acetylglucosamine deacetylase [Chlamydiae bacterium]|nr:Peptidoglycan-N-acetylglucosamine deacetylase [Chlamydiota bacterium]
MPESQLFGKKERVEQLLEKLDRLNLQVVFFAIGANLDSKEGKECAELASQQGHFLANHSYHHGHLSEMTNNEFSNEIKSTEDLLKNYQTFRRWYRFPFLDFGARKGNFLKRARAFQTLKKLGYQHGHVTINTFDWHINGLLQKALREGREVDYKALKGVYLALLEEWIDHYQSEWERFYKGKITHTLLLHANDLNTLFIEDIVELLKRKKWTIVSPKKAFYGPLQKVVNRASAIKAPESLSCEKIDEALDYALPSS